MEGFTGRSSLLYHLVPPTPGPLFVAAALVDRVLSGRLTLGSAALRAVASGAVQNIITISAEPRGGVWTPDGMIYYAPHNVAPLWKVAASGGTPVEATKLDVARGEVRA